MISSFEFGAFSFFLSIIFSFSIYGFPKSFYNAQTILETQTIIYCPLWEKLSYSLGPIPLLFLPLRVRDCSGKPAPNPYLVALQRKSRSLGTRPKKVSIEQETNWVFLPCIRYFKSRRLENQSQKNKLNFILLGFLTIFDRQ